MKNFFNWIQNRGSVQDENGCRVNRGEHGRVSGALMFLRSHFVTAVIIGSSVIVANVAQFYYHPRIQYSYEIVRGERGVIVEASEPIDISQFGISIEKIGVWVPIIPEVDTGNTTAYLDALKKGVALSKDSPNPTEVGNMFLFGHSSYLDDSPGPNKEVFKSLNELTPGDTFTVYYLGQAYSYQVTESKKVAADDFSIMNQTPEDPNDKTLTIMTCWPPGTVKYRWAVFARQIV